jgi:hypothetical protein
MNDRNRILFVSPSHPELDPGTQAKAAHDLFLHARQSGLDCHFLAGCNPDTPAALFKPGAVITGIDERPAEFLFLSDACEPVWSRNLSHRALSWLADFLKEINPAIVHFDHYRNFGIDAALIARRALPDARLFLSLHDFLPICRAEGRMVRLTDHSICSRASPVRCHQCFPKIAPEMFRLREDWMQHALSVFDGLLVANRAVRDIYIEWGLHEDKIHIVPPGHQISVDDRDSLPTQPSSATQMPNRFCCFVNTADARAMDTIMTALEVYGNSFDDPIVMDFHGNWSGLNDGPARDFVNSIIAKSDKLSATVRFRDHGTFVATSVATHVAQTDWLLVPMAWIDAADPVVGCGRALGKPSIISAVGALAQGVRQNTDGLLFDLGDAHSLAQVLHRCVTEVGLHDRLRRCLPKPLRPDDVLQTIIGIARRYGSAQPQSAPAVSER